jgi:heavy metal translocating P-type ATPase
MDLGKAEPVFHVHDESAPSSGIPRCGLKEADLNKALHALDTVINRDWLRSIPQEKHAIRKRQNILLQLLVASAFGMQVMLLYLLQLYPLYARGGAGSASVRNLEYLAWALTTPVLFIGGYSFLHGAWRALRAASVGMDTLVSLGTLSAYGYSVYNALEGQGEVYFDSVAMVTTFITLGRYLEKSEEWRARKDIRELLKLQPETAWRRSDDQWQEVEAFDLKRGDHILIKPGERMPVDGRVMEGMAAVDETRLTSAARPIQKSVGDPVFAGTLVVDETLRCEVVQPVDGTRMAEIKRMVQEILNAKPPAQRLADQVARYLVFSVVAAASLTFLGWSMAGATPTKAVLTAVTVLVIACPCALGLATPLALTRVLGQASKEGVLVRNPVAFETAAKIDAVVFDKTGTLTQGCLTVSSVMIAPGVGLNDTELLRYAAAVTQYCGHPLAQAIVTASSGSRLDGREFRMQHGKGASAKVVENNGEQHVVKVGSSSFIQVDDRHALFLAALSREKKGDTIVWVARDGEVIGFVTLRDEPMPTSIEAVRRLNKKGIRTAILSGDQARTVKAIAEKLGIEVYIGNLDSIEKVEYIRQWQKIGWKMAMVGDGINDAPALAQADLSITVAAGTGVAGETSDIILTRPDLNLIPWLIRISTRTRRIIQENLGWAFAYNLLAVPLAAFGVVSPVIAATAMATSSLFVVVNSLRLRNEAVNAHAES